MTVSMRAMSAGDRYERLPRTVAAIDSGDRKLQAPQMMRYYDTDGTLLTMLTAFTHQIEGLGVEI